MPTSACNRHSYRDLHQVSYRLTSILGLFWDGRFIRRSFITSSSHFLIMHCLTFTFWLFTSIHFLIIYLHSQSCTSCTSHFLTMHIHTHRLTIIYSKLSNHFKCTPTSSSTRTHDEEAMRYLSLVMYPLVLGYSMYSLAYETHKSWCAHGLLHSSHRAYLWRVRF